LNYLLMYVLAVVRGHLDDPPNNNDIEI